MTPLAAARLTSTNTHFIRGLLPAQVVYIPTPPILGPRQRQAALASPPALSIPVASRPAPAPGGGPRGRGGGKGVGGGRAGKSNFQRLIIFRAALFDSCSSTPWRSPSKCAAAIARPAERLFHQRDPEDDVLLGRPGEPRSHPAVVDPIGPSTPDLQLL